MQVLPHLNSGGLVSVVEIAKELANSNFKSLVVSSGGYKENEILRNNNIRETASTQQNIFTIISNKKKIIDLAVKYNIRLIHARSRAPAWSAYWASRELKIPFVTTFHGTYGTETLLKKFNSVMLKGNAVIAISKFIKQHIKMSME